MINEQIATININPHKRNWKSNLTLGGVPDDLIEGSWYDHTFTVIDNAGFTESLMML